MTHPIKADSNVEYSKFLSECSSETLFGTFKFFRRKFKEENPKSNKETLIQQFIEISEELFERNDALELMADFLILVLNEPRKSEKNQNSSQEYFDIFFDILTNEIGNKKYFGVREFAFEINKRLGHESPIQNFDEDELDAEDQLAEELRGLYTDNSSGFSEESAPPSPTKTQKFSGLPLAPTKDSKSPTTA